MKLLPSGIWLWSHRTFNTPSAKVRGSLPSNLIEIGRLLVEAKTMVEPKSWDKYIWDNFGYSTSSADNWMKLYREYGDNQESLFDSFTNSPNVWEAELYPASRTDGPARRGTFGVRGK